MRRLLRKLDVDLRIVMYAGILIGCAASGYWIWHSRGALLHGLFIAALGPLFCLFLGGGMPSFVIRGASLNPLVGEQVHLRVGAILFERAANSTRLVFTHGVLWLTNLRMVFQSWDGPPREISLMLSSITRVEQSRMFVLIRLLDVYAQQGRMQLSVNNPKLLREKIDVLRLASTEQSVS